MLPEVFVIGTADKIQLLVMFKNEVELPKNVLHWTPVELAK